MAILFFCNELMQRAHTKINAHGNYWRAAWVSEGWWKGKRRNSDFLLHVSTLAMAFLFLHGEGRVVFTSLVVFLCILTFPLPTFFSISLFSFLPSCHLPRCKRHSCRLVFSSSLPFSLFLSEIRHSFLPFLSFFCWTLFFFEMEVFFGREEGERWSLVREMGRCI